MAKKDAPKQKAPMKKKPAAKRKKKVGHTAVAGNAYISASFNNTIVTITDKSGATQTWQVPVQVVSKEAESQPHLPPAQQPRRQQQQQATWA